MEVGRQEPRPLPPLCRQEKVHVRREPLVPKVPQPPQPQQHAFLRQRPPRVPLELRLEPFPAVLEAWPLRSRVVLLHEPVEPLQHVDGGALLREQQPKPWPLLRAHARPPLLLLQRELLKEPRQPF